LLRAQWQATRGGEPASSHTNSAAEQIHSGDNVEDEDAENGLFFGSDFLATQRSIAR
jgi:hypothetical protein